MKRFLALSLLTGLMPALPVSAQAENVVDVVGARREAQLLDRPGTSYVIRPVDATRFDTKTQLSRSASLALPETGRVNASGFVIPRVRGQDTRLTEVYAGDMLLQDPYSGLPLVDELDLRAFGELAIHQGTAPLDLPTVGGIGIVQYRPRPITSTSLTVGATSGRPYGLAGFTVHDRAFASIGTRIYARQHATDGRYQYLDDGGTPYNTDDDSMRSRTGNDRRSQQVVPTVAWRQGPHRIDALGLWQRGRTGIPPARYSDPHATESVTTSLSSMRYERHIPHTFVLAPTAVQLHLGHHDDTRNRDDAGDAVGSSAASGLSVLTRRAGIGVLWDSDDHNVRADTDTSRASIAQSGGSSSSLRRDAHGLHLGVGSRLGTNWQLENKIVWRRHTDLDTAVATRNDQLASGSASHRDHRGASSAWGLRLANWSVYAQGAVRERPPSLLEEFGDAAYVRSNPDLDNEKSRHVELGGSVWNMDRSARIGSAIFNDLTTDRLTFVPSLSQSVRAVNIGKANIRGAEMNGDLLLGDTNIIGSVTRLWPEDRTVSASVRRLPGVPEWFASIGLSHKVDDVTARWQSRYRGKLYRDPLNDIQLPASLVHDAAVDMNWTWSLDPQVIEFDTGLAVDNVTNVTSLPISARQGAKQSGEVAYGDVAGFPLPGRQWRLTASATYKM